ncbi:MAG TPA: hypothetical protein VGK16_08375 [Candidatus Limnocylindrales bacterium]|jgi:hypothetical protein
MNRITVRHIDVIRAANLVAILYAVVVVAFGLLILVPFALVGGIAGARGDSFGAIGLGMGGGLVVLLIGVVFYGGIGWVTTAIACALYNVVAARVGGFRFVADIEGPGASTPPYGGQPALPAAGSPAIWPVPGRPQGGPPAPPA